MTKKKIFIIIGTIILTISIAGMAYILYRPEVLQQTPFQTIFPTPTPTYEEVFQDFKEW